MNKKNFNNIYIASRFILFAISTNSYADVNSVIDLGTTAPRGPSRDMFATENSKKNKTTFIRLHNEKATYNFVTTYARTGKNEYVLNCPTTVGLETIN